MTGKEKYTSKDSKMKKSSSKDRERSRSKDIMKERSRSFGDVNAPRVITSSSGSAPSANQHVPILKDAKGNLFYGTIPFPYSDAQSRSSTGISSLNGTPVNPGGGLLGGNPVFVTGGHSGGNPVGPVGWSSHQVNSVPHSTMGAEQMQQLMLPMMQELISPLVDTVKSLQKEVLLNRTGENSQGSMKATDKSGEESGRSTIPIHKIYDETEDENVELLNRKSVELMESAVSQVV